MARKRKAVAHLDEFPDLTDPITRVKFAQESVRLLDEAVSLVLIPWKFFEWHKKVKLVDRRIEHVNYFNQKAAIRIANYLRERDAT